MADVAAIQAEELGHFAAVREEGAVAVGFFDAFDFVSDVGVRLIPRDALPLVLAAQLALGVVAAARLPRRALHGVLQTIGGKHVVALCAAAHASALLRIVGAVFMRVVGFLANDHAIFDQRLVQATASAVVPACSRDPGTADDVGSRRGLLIFLSRLHLVGTASGKTARHGQSCRGRSARLDEPPSAHPGRLPNLVLVVSHLSSSDSHSPKT